MSAADEVIQSADSKMTSPEPGLRRQVMSYSQGIMLVRHKMEPGWVGAAHSHPHEQLIYVVSGAIQLTVIAYALSRRQHPSGRWSPASGQHGPGDRGSGRFYAVSHRLRR